MTIGIAILVLWLFRIIVSQIYSLEYRVEGSGCLGLTLGLIYILVTAWMIIRFWNVPW